MTEQGNYLLPFSLFFPSFYFYNLRALCYIVLNIFLLILYPNKTWQTWVIKTFSVAEYLTQLASMCTWVCLTRECIRCWWHSYKVALKHANVNRIQQSFHWWLQNTQLISCQLKASLYIGPIFAHHKHVDLDLDNAMTTQWLKTPLQFDYNKMAMKEWLQWNTNDETNVTAACSDVGIFTCTSYLLPLQVTAPCVTLDTSILLQDSSHLQSGGESREELWN